MKNGILTIMKKEFARFFGDKRVLITTLILPGLMIYLVYSFMGDALVSSFHVKEDYVPSIYAVQLPEYIAVAAEASGIEIKDVEDVEDIKLSIRDQNTDLLMIFPEDFDVRVKDFDSLSGEKAPDIEIYYNSASITSGNFFNMFYSILDEYEATLSNKFDINYDDGTVFDLVTERDAAAFMIAGMMPLLMMVFMFTGCMAVAPESIAGEKERGTIATLLVTPLKRRELAIGKLLSLSVIALLSGLSSTIGSMASLPKMMSLGESQLSMDMYTPLDYGLMAAIILSTVLLIVSLISVISAFAKTIKEATTAVTPLMIVVMLVGVSAMFSQGGQQGEVAYYLVPLYNTVQSLVGIFSWEYNTVNLVVTICSNIVYAGIGGFFLTKMFSSEKIVFSK